MKAKARGNGNENGGDLGGFGRQPGEYIERQITSESESALVEKQAWIFTKALFVIELAVALVVLVAYLAFGVIVIAACGELALGLGCLAWIKLRERAAMQRGDSKVEVGVPIMMLIVASVVLFFTWTRILDAMSQRTALMVLALVLTGYFAIPFIVPRTFLTWRMAAEISDIGISRNALSEYFKPVWPWTKNDELASQLTEEPNVPDYVGEVVRPITINGNVRRADAVPKTWTSERTGLTWPAMDKPHVVERENGARYVLSPTGEYLSVQDLMNFIQVGIRGGAGAAYRQWKRDKRTRPNGLSEERWRSIVHYLAEIGVVNVPMDKARTVFVADSVRDATSLLMGDITAEEGDPELTVSAPSGNGKHPLEDAQSNVPIPPPANDVSGVVASEGVDR